MGEMTAEQLYALATLALNNGIVLIAERDDKVVGIIAGRIIDGAPMGKFFEEIRWYVDPGNRGIGVLLFKRMIEACEEEGCEGIAMAAYCNEHLDNVDRFYKRTGFRVNGLEIDYYRQRVRPLANIIGIVKLWESPGKALTITHT